MSRGRLARASVAVLALQVWLGQAGCAAIDTPPKEDRMDSITEVTLSGDGPPRRVGSDEARAMAAALERALHDGELLNRSKAPAELLAGLPRSAGVAQFTHGGQLRAGAWLATSTVDGARWEYRVMLPEGNRVGLMFRAPMQLDAAGWRVTAIEFLRIR